MSVKSTGTRVNHLAAPGINPGGPVFAGKPYAYGPYGRCKRKSLALEYPENTKENDHHDQRPETGMHQNQNQEKPRPRIENEEARGLHRIAPVPVFQISCHLNHRPR